MVELAHPVGQAALDGRSSGIGNGFPSCPSGLSRLAPLLSRLAPVRRGLAFDSLGEELAEAALRLQVAPDHH